MNGRSAAGLVALAMVTAVARWFSLGEGRSTPRPVVESTAARNDARTAGSLPSAAPTPTQPSPEPDPRIAYAHMRDDINPKPRLQMIDAWARRVSPGDDLDLLSYAMVDPDESVRERAAVLFDREVTRAPERAGTPGRRDLADESTRLPGHR